MTFLENIVLFLSKSEKNNNQTVSGGERQGKVYGIVTPVSDSIQLAATDNNTRPKPPARIFFVKHFGFWCRSEVTKLHAVSAR